MLHEFQVLAKIAKLSRALKIKIHHFTPKFKKVFWRKTAPRGQDTFAAARINLINLLFTYIFLQKSRF